MTIALSILVGIIALWWALRFLPAGADGHRLLPYLIAFVRFLWMPSAVILAVALVSRHWAVALFAAILTILTGISASPWYRKKHDTSGKRDQAQQSDDKQRISNSDNPYTVMTLNCRYGLADPQAIADAVRSNDVSILALQELTPGLVAALDKAGMNALLPYCQLGKAQESDNGGFNGIWTRAKPDAQTSGTVDIAAADVPHCRVNGMTVYSAHPKSPMRGCREWSHGIRKLAELTHPSASAIPFGSSAPSSLKTTHEVIIMGDLNSNIDHPSFRSLLNAGLQDAGLGSSHSTVSSFPTWLPWPRLELDHVLTTQGITVSSIQTVNIPGSDHLALIARLHNC